MPLSAPLTPSNRRCAYFDRFPHLCLDRARSTKWVCSFPAEKDVLQDIAEGEHALEGIIGTNNHQPVYSALADGMENRFEAVMHRARMHAREVLSRLHQHAASRA